MATSVIFGGVVRRVWKFLKKKKKKKIINRSDFQYFKMEIKTPALGRTELWPVDKIKNFIDNPKLHPPEQIDKIAASIRKFGFLNPAIVDPSGELIAGHGRLMAVKQLGGDVIPVRVVSHLSPDEKKAFLIADNKSAESAWDEALLGKLLTELKTNEFDMSSIGFSDEELGRLVILDEDEAPAETSRPGLTPDNQVPAVPDKVKTKPFDYYRLGPHTLFCGDATNAANVKDLMGDYKADLVFTDPPYGMKKESEGVLNDNLNYKKLLEFNRQWIANAFDYLADAGSFYCWGQDEPLMDMYHEIFKPMILNQVATFRNLITWDKGSAQGQLTPSMRMYTTADEKCLFIMKGVQGFNNNADNYFEGWEPIRDYLLKSRLEMGWDVAAMKKIVGHSDLSRDHWTSKSQFNFPTRKVYDAMKAEADRLRGKTSNDAFGKTYDAFKMEYDVLKATYDKIKQDYYGTRAYFNNTHEIMNNVWHFARHNRDGSEGGHATPKPIDLCERAIKTSSREGEIVLDLFGGSGSTLIACEKLRRSCLMLELDPRWCDVIIQRWENFTGHKAVLLK